MSILMLDIAGYELTAEDREILEHPLTGGLIFFTRNYHDPKQIQELARQVKKAAKKPILIAVDQEGGRVQRFRDGFSALPAMGKILEKSENNIELAGDYASAFAELMALEIQSVGIDISFAPVADINDISDVIGDRGFAKEKQRVVELVSAFCKGMKKAGMATTGKHYPGHGSVKEDSHIALPIDRREKAEILEKDFWVFEQLSQQGALDAVMPAHVIYPEIDDQPAGFSDVWLKHYLRQQLLFDGVIFSDDLAMEGAVSSGAPTERAQIAMNAGCDMVLMCNNREDAVSILDNYTSEVPESNRVKRMIQPNATFSSLNHCRDSARWAELRRKLDAFDEL